MALAYVQTRRETTSAPGNESVTPTYASAVLFPPALSVNAQLNPSPLMRDDEIRNIDEPLSIVPESHAPEWSIESRMYPNTIGHLLTNMLGAPTTTAGNGVITDPDTVAIPVGAHRHVWTAPFAAGAIPTTFDMRLAYRDQGVFYQAKGCATSSMAITSPESGGARVSASGPALFFARISDPALSPSYEALTVLPFMRRHLTLTWLSGSATTEDFSLNISNPVETVRSLGIASGFPDVVEKAETPVTFTGSIPKRQLDETDYDALLNSTGFTATARWVSSSIIASAYPYKLFVQFANCQYTGGQIGALENRRRIGASFDFKGTTTGSAGHVTITLVNATSSMA